MSTVEGSLMNSTRPPELLLSTANMTSEREESMNIFFEFILHGVILNAVGLVGLFGNLVCIIILRRPKMRRSSTNLILATLATFDFLLIITSILMLGLPAVFRYTLDAFFGLYYYEVFPYITKWVYAFGLIAQTGSIYCTLGVTVERYIVICWPLRSATICTYGRVKFGIVCTILFSIFYNIPRFFEVSWTYAPETDGGTNDITDDLKPQIVMTPLRQDPHYISIYITWMYLVFMYVLPFGGLSVLNLLMFLDVRRSNSRQSTLSPHEKKELRLAVMLMVVVVVFLTCNILPLIVNILEVLRIELKPLTETSNLLVTLNSSVNVFIYIIFGEKFQKQFLEWMKTFWCCKLIFKAPEGVIGPTATTACSMHNNNQTFQAPFSGATQVQSPWFAKCRGLARLKVVRKAEHEDDLTSVVLRESRNWSNSTQGLRLNGELCPSLNPSPCRSQASDIGQSGDTNSKDDSLVVRYDRDKSNVTTWKNSDVIDNQQTSPFL